MLHLGDVISYIEMCLEEGVNLQRGMNFRLKGGHSVILMSVRQGAPYADRVEQNGRVLIYEGHDVPQSATGPDPKSVNQSMRYPGGTLTQNGLFFEAARRFKALGTEPEIIRVYEKIKSGIWSFNGLFHLIDAWMEASGGRNVFKFRLEIIEDQAVSTVNEQDLQHNRVIPTAVKLAVWQRDKGRCVMCGSTDNLHFDHVVPYSKGGSSLTADNIQLLCARHNLQKHDRIV